MLETLVKWDDLRVVLAIGRAGSLSAAARALRVSHPTVFRRLNQIEERLGVRLFERGRSGYGLTLAGEEMLALAERMESDVVALERRLAGRDLRPSGSLRVTTTDTLLIDFLSPIFAGFRLAYPAIELNIVISNEMFSLSKRDADVAVRPSSNPPESLVGRRLSTIAMAVFGHRDLLSDGAAGRSLQEFPWVGPDESLSDLPMARWLTEQELERRLVYRVNSLLGCLDAARNGIGLAVLPCYLGRASAELAQLGAPIEALESELWLLTHPDLRHVARIRSFFDYMAEALKPQLSRLAGR